MFADAYRGRRVLLTGHTGFKGSWLGLWLTELGADITGISLPPPTSPNHWDALGLSVTHHQQDIRDGAAVSKIIREAKPEIVFHLAAQPLVRRSYHDPLETWSTNVMGTANVLEACRAAQGVKAIVVVTTDKCYENQERDQAHKETDRLGGADPYSASKASVELLAASYRASFFQHSKSPLLATARAGNVIGGGDWSEDRLVPDIFRAYASGNPLIIRNPGATRPWQHVLESLSGYLLLGQKLMEGGKRYACAWNFGPHTQDAASVDAVLDMFKQNWPGLSWQVKPEPQMQETQLLMLDSSKAHKELGWKPVWNLKQAISATASWYETYRDQKQVQSKMQLLEYMNALAAQGATGDAA